MDFSAANTALWNPMIQLGVISGLILLANSLRRKVKLIRQTLMPTAVLAGFIMLLLRTTGIIPFDTAFLETLTYHMLALGFIAMSLRIPAETSQSEAGIGSKSGALIVSTYLVQALVGFVVSIGLAFTIMPEFYKPSGILLAMAFGQGPGQANNVGATYEALGMVGGRSFGLSLAATGYLVACIVGVIFLNIFTRKGMKGRVKAETILSGSVTVGDFQDENEIPVAESIDKLSMQIAFIMFVYLLTYLVTKTITGVLMVVAPGLAAMVSTLLWGFNFIIGSVLALVCAKVIAFLRKKKIMNRQYQNNYLLSRLSGAAFDIMIVAGIASINIEDLSGLLLPFILMAVFGGIATMIYLYFMCKKLYPGYEYEGFFSMFGMLTGTISSGVLLLREIDPNFETPAANNLITGSSFGIAFAAPVLLLVSTAAKSEMMFWITVLLIFLYLVVLLLFIFKFRKKKAEK